MSEEERTLLLRCLRQMFWLAGEGLQGIGLEDPADLYCEIIAKLGMTAEQINAFEDETAKMQEEGRA